MKKFDIIFGAVKVPLDFSAAFSALFIAYSIRKTTDLIPGVNLGVAFVPNVMDYVIFALIASLGLVLIFSLNGYYTLEVTRSLRKEIGRAFYGCVLWVMLIISYFFLIRDLFYSRLVLLYSFILTFIFLVLIRIFLSYLKKMFLARGYGRNRVVFVGETSISKKVATLLTKSHGYDVVGKIGNNYENFLLENNINEVIQTKHTEDDTFTSNLVSFCRQNHIRYRTIPDIVELQMSNVNIEWLGEIPVIELRPTRLDGWGRVQKRLFDIVGAIFGIIILFPVWIITALAVAIQMRSIKEVFFFQKRYGYKGKLFWFYKFQSMRVGAVKEHEELMKQSERQGFLKLKKDPRVTKVGRVIRKTSLDELPQLINVLKGNMSLVGPRPHMPTEIDLVTKDYKRVLSVKPGITGLAQISGRSSLDFEDEMKLDLSYIEQWSLWHDVVIIVKTVLKIVRREDAS